MICAATALALITLTQREYCEVPIDPYLSIEDDVVAMRRLDPLVIDKMPPSDHFIAANTYFDEYLGFEGVFPWLDPLLLMPATPPDHIARPREPGSNSAVEWESISVLPVDYFIVWPPDPYIRLGARYCTARPFHFKSESSAPTDIAPSVLLSSTPPPPPPPTKTAETASPSTSISADTPPLQNATASTLPPLPSLPEYKLSGLTVLWFTAVSLAALFAGTWLWWQWRRRRDRVNFQTLLDDLAMQEAGQQPAHAATVRQRSGPHTLRVRKTLFNPSQPNELRVQGGVRRCLSLFERTHALYWTCLLNTAQTVLNWRAKIGEILLQFGHKISCSGQAIKSRIRFTRKTPKPPPKTALVPTVAKTVSIRVANKRRKLAWRRGVVQVNIQATPRTNQLRLTSTKMCTISSAHFNLMSKGSQTTGVKRVCASVQTPQALAGDESPRRRGLTLRAKSNTRLRPLLARHNGSAPHSQDPITDTSDLEDPVSPDLPSTAISSPSPLTYSAEAPRKWDSSPPPGFEGGWQGDEGFLEACHQLLQDMDNWDTPASCTPLGNTTGGGTASTLGENEASQDIHSLLYALTGKMMTDEDIAALLQHNSER